MRQTDKNGFTMNLRPGDTGLILSNNIFSTIQNWRRIKEKASARASHAFMMRDGINICEANGLHISNATVIKNIGDSTKCWIFRNTSATPEQIDDIMDYMDGAVENGGTYSIGGIIQFALQYIGIRKKLTDESGSFCSEFDVRTNRKAGLPCCESLKPYEIDPSMLLSWLLSDEAKGQRWILAGCYDGEGNYFIE